MRSILRIALLVCVAAVLAAGMAGCSKGGKQQAEFEPGGDWLADMRARITEQIDDTETATALLKELDQVQAELDAFDAVVKDYYAQLDALDRDYGTRRADYENAIMTFNTARMAARDRVIDSRFRMRDKTTPDQWAIVADIDKSLLNEFQRGYSL